MFELPVASRLPLIRESVRVAGAGGFVVVRAEPGSGKTSLVPAALAEDTSGKSLPGVVLVTEPRRLAAIGAATFAAKLRGESVGHTIGYAVRGDSAWGPQTKVLYVTEGVALNLLADERFVARVTALVLDEFHERHATTDVLMLLARRWSQHLQHLPGAASETVPNVRPGAPVFVLMSATFDELTLGRSLPRMSLIDVPGVVHPLTITYEPLVVPVDPSRPAAMTGLGVWSSPLAWAQVARVLLREAAALAPGGGALLCFLPGKGEIAKVLHEVRGWLDQAAQGGAPPSFQATVAELHGDRPLAELTQAIARQQGEARRPGHVAMFLSTNIAESSLTIPGVRVVVDTGLVRVARHHLSSGAVELSLDRIGQHSAVQRSGRAAREGPGRAIRLCDEDEFLRRPLDTVPEIALSDLSRNLLDLLRGLGALLPEQAMPVSVDDWLQQPWLLSPPRERLEAALRILQQSRALDGMGHITATGRQLAELPVTVRLGCIAVAASQRYRNGTLGQDILHATLVLCALLSEGDLQPRAAASRGDAQDTDEHDNALERQYVLFCRLAGGQQPNSADLARRLARLQETLRSLWRGCGLVGAESWTLKDLVAVLPTELPLESCAAVFFAGYADAVALASGPGLLMHMTGESYVAPCVTQPGWHLVLEGVRLQSAGRKGSQTHKLASKVLPLDPVHLLDGPEEWLCEAQEVEAPKGAAPGLVRVRQVLRYGQLIMDQQQLKVDDSGFAKALSAWLLREHMARVMSCDAMVQLGKRLAVARPLLPEAAATSEGSLDPEALAQRLAVFLCSERGHAATSVSVDWDELTQEGCCARWALEPGVLAVLNRAAPSRLRLDNGIVVAVDYTGEQPTLVGKIQEFFGLVRHPQVSTAITKPTIQLQAPGGQTAQITADLVAFWTSSYPAVKKAYLGRYPKHHWPDDPAQAKPFLTKRQATLGIIRSGS